MNTSQHEVTANLTSCLPLYKKLFKIPGYRLTDADKGCLDMFHRLWEAGLLDDDEVLKAAGIGLDEFGILLGYVTIAKEKAAAEPG